jgi:uncharacterized membrane protein HdeD (DUF308 family)
LETNKPNDQLEPTQPTVDPNAAPQPPEDMDELQTRVHNYPEKTWTLIQRIAGGALGLLCGLLLTYFSNFESIGMFSTIGAVLIALLLPNVIEKRVRRKIQKGRAAMLIGLAAWLAGYTLIMVLSGVPLLQPK